MSKPLTDDHVQKFCTDRIILVVQIVLWSCNIGTLQYHRLVPAILKLGQAEHWIMPLPFFIHWRENQGTWAWTGTRFVGSLLNYYHLDLWSIWSLVLGVNNLKQWNHEKPSPAKPIYKKHIISSISRPRKKPRKKKKKKGMGHPKFLYLCSKILLVPKQWQKL